MKTTLNRNTFIQRFRSLSGNRPLWNLMGAAAPRAAFLVLVALALAAFGGWERLIALADVVPGGYVQLQPNAATLNQGATLQLRAAVLNPLGFELPNRKVAWSSSNPAIASVNDAGLLTAVASGTVTIIAKSGAALGTASITVNGIVPPPPNTAPTVSITAPTDGATFQQGDAITFTATATDAEDGNLDAQLVWTAAVAGNPSAITPLGAGASVSSNSLAPGSYLITARVTDRGSLAGIAQIGITVNGPCSVVAHLFPPSGFVTPGDVTLDASGSYDTCNRPLQYKWDCGSPTSILCPNFQQQANSNDYANSVVTLNVGVDDVFDIALTVCVANTNECANQLFRTFLAQEIDLSSASGHRNAGANSETPRGALKSKATHGSN